MAMTMATRSVTGTAVLCFLVASLLLAASSSVIAATATTEAAAAYGAGAGRKMKQTAAAGAVATKQDDYGYPGTNELPPGYPTAPGMN
ncbi:hypothetical protein BDA96_05G145100 [Sorghum bicolor]|uniref:Uncharacterized protein n=2 Tax=Sorghum bicolor TaxID=4558 RepID=A0A921QYV2_SORBI|nr:hypothetical protein BDA96_05G145100 [Sorghum bicolor]KXG28516.1 hypothetical protein SORBI_3005G131700 [Sorghum bicolor]